jgi:N-acyl amino acid synthase of PEP-CTERM/exosortase system
LRIFLSAAKGKVIDMSEADARRSAAAMGAKGAKEQSLADNFLEYFSAEIANTPDLLSEAFKLRYRVYCEEFKYEEVEHFPDQAETDDFDSHSISCLIRHKSTGLAAGCIRVVTVDGLQDLPLERFCIDSINEEYLDVLGSDRSQLCEFSRLAVNSHFRRRPKEFMSRVGGEITAEEERTFPLIAVASFLTAFVVAEFAGRNSVFAMMEPFLPRILKRSGIVPEAAGVKIDYHGERAAYFITRDKAINSLNDELLMLYKAIKRAMEDQSLNVAISGDRR